MAEDTNSKYGVIDYASLLNQTNLPLDPYISQRKQIKK